MYLSTIVSADIDATGRISDSTFAYLGQRAKNLCYDFVMKKFLASGLSKADLARRMGKSPDRVNHMLATPANWTIRTIVELLAAISEEEFVPHSEKLAGRPPKNMTQADLLFGNPSPSPPSPSVTGSSAKVHVLEAVVIH